MSEVNGENIGAENAGAGESEVNQNAGASEVNTIEGAPAGDTDQSQDNQAQDNQGASESQTPREPAPDQPAPDQPAPDAPAKRIALEAAAPLIHACGPNGETLIRLLPETTSDQVAVVNSDHSLTEKLAQVDGQLDLHSIANNALAQNVASHSETLAEHAQTLTEHAQAIQTLGEGMTPDLTNVNAAIAECQTGIAANKTALEGMANHGERITASETAIAGMADHGDRIAANETALAGMANHGDRIAANETAIVGMADHDSRITAAQTKADEAKTAADNAAQTVDAKADKTYVDEELAKKLDAKLYITRGVVGVAQTDIGVAGRKLTRIDVDGKQVFANPNFNSHPIYSNIAEQNIDGQDMVRIPKFFFKRGIGEGGIECLDAWSISDTALPGYEVHPAFLAKDGETALDQIWIGKYQASDDGGTKAASKPDAMAVYSITFSKMQNRCAARNTNGVDGFHLWNVHEWSMVALLMLIEFADTEIAKYVGFGYKSATCIGEPYNPTNKPEIMTLNWRGLIGLYGNFRQLCDGLKANHNTALIDMGKGYIQTDITITKILSDIYLNRILKFRNNDVNFDHLFLADVTNPVNTDSSYSQNAFASECYYVYQNAETRPMIGGECKQAHLYRDSILSVTITSQNNGASTGRLAKW